jgi:hypothetical protein
MQRELHAFPEINHELRSKLIDGVLSAVILCLMWLVVALSIRPVEVAMGRPGLLIYVLGLMAIAVLCLQQAQGIRRSEPAQAWYGMAGGFLAWAVASVSEYFGLPVQNSAGLILLIMVSLIVAQLWRVLPIGARFFGAAFLLNWLGTLVMILGEMLAKLSPILTFLYRATGYLALLLALLGLGWVLFSSKRRIERITGALGIWFLLSLALLIFQGSLF